jgi:mercuric ion transport protein
LRGRALIREGAAGAILAAICCATPLLAVLLPLIGLSAWLARADLVLLSLLTASLGLFAWGLHHHRAKAACCETNNQKEGVNP